MKGRVAVRVRKGKVTHRVFMVDATMEDRRWLWDNPRSAVCVGCGSKVMGHNMVVVEAEGHRRTVYCREVCAEEFWSKASRSIGALLNAEVRLYDIRVGDDD